MADDPLDLIAKLVGITAALLTIIKYFYPDNQFFLDTIYGYSKIYLPLVTPMIISLLDYMKLIFIKIGPRITALIIISLTAYIASLSDEWGSPDFGDLLRIGAIFSLMLFFPLPAIWVWVYYSILGLKFIILFLLLYYLCINIAGLLKSY
jgi:hypothetical protein